jgi:hypothetical protein
VNGPPGRHTGCQMGSGRTDGNQMTAGDDAERSDEEERRL